MLNSLNNEQKFAGTDTNVMCGYALKNECGQFELNLLDFSADTVNLTFFIQFLMKRVSIIFQCFPHHSK